MPHSWLAYLPPHLAADLLAHPDASPLERVLQQQAVALFADISGFTPMSEALGKVGPHGTEELSGILNRTFGTMLAIIAHYGGSVGKFAGDALTVVFPYQQVQQRGVVRRAIQCALDMQAAMLAAPDHTTSAGPFTLAMKIGLGMGSLVTTTIGDPTIRLEYLLSGSAIERCTAAEQEAPKGAVVVDAALLPLGGVIDTTVVAPGFACVHRLRRTPHPAPLPPLPAPPPALQQMLAMYLPPAIAERLRNEQHAFVDEHRPLTVVFVRFAPRDSAEALMLAQVRPYLADVVHIIARYDGTLRQVDVGDKGSLFIALFGAPHAHEDDAERAVRCAQELGLLAHTHRLITHTGIASGHVFCGLVGSEIRREYAAIGDTVNVAARLMSAAQPDQILVTERTRQVLREVFVWTELPPMPLKGKREPLPVVALDRRMPKSPTRLRSPSYTLPMVGRTKELAVAQHVLTQVLAGHGQLLHITAEAGMGKSRLVAELLRGVSKQPIRYYTSECLSYATTSSYLVWQNLVRALFQLTPAMDHEACAQQVRNQLAAIAPELVERMPLLNPVLGTTFPDTSWTRSLDAKLRKSALETLLVTCLRSWTHQFPLLLILEDCHWIDELSRDLLTLIAEQLQDLPLLLIMTARPDEGERPILTLDRLRVLPWYHAITLTEFTAMEAEQLIGLRLARVFGAQGAPAAVVARLHERAQGNPFYLDELLNLLHDRGIDPEDVEALVQLELPDTLQRLILSRIDQLAEGPKLVLKVASVIGRLFKAHWLWAVVPTLGQAEQIVGHLALLQQQDLTQLERREPEMEYLFKHLLTRDVAYDSLAHTTRVALHEQIGHYIEQAHADEVERWINLLAYHYGQSPNVAKQRIYFRKAAAAAAKAYANGAAIEYYERAVPLLEGMEQAAAQLELSGVLSRVGQWEAADRNIRVVLAGAEERGDAALQARCLYLLGNNLSYTGFAERGMPYLEQARERFKALGNHNELGETLQQIGHAHWMQGRLDEALACQMESLRLFTETKVKTTHAGLLNDIGLVYQVRGDYAAAMEWFERALAMASASNDLHWMAGIQQNMMGIYSERGDYVEAMSYGQRSLAIALQIGYTHLIQTILVNIARRYANVGAYEQGLLCIQASILLERTRSSPRTLAYCINLAAWFYSKLGQTIEAERLFIVGLALGRTLKQAQVVAVFGHLHAVHYLRQGHYREAKIANHEALMTAVEMGSQRLELERRLLDIQLQVLDGQITLEEAHFQLERVREQWTDEEQQALIAFTCWEIDPTNEAVRQEAAERCRALYARIPNVEYRQRYETLTGTRLPEPPAMPDVPPNVARTLTPIDVLIARADALLAEQECIVQHGRAISG